MRVVQAVAERVLNNVQRVIIGKHNEARMTLLALLCEGHLLIEDVPGVGKTMLARTIARSVGCSFRRIQFTPDMLPSDVTGVSIYNQKTQEFEFRAGPIMAQIVLTDEINRATPKTQSALLEAMEERQITVDGVTHPMPRPFLVLATQNPIEYEGTFPLPEAQVDRFMMRIHLGYPTKVHEVDVLTRQADHHPIEDIQQVVSVEELVEAQQVARTVYVDELVKNYIVDIVSSTRDHPDIYLGASPRGSLALFSASRAWAAIEGRDYVIPDDIKLLAEATLAHRLIVSPSARIKNVSARQVIEEALRHTAVPGRGPKFASVMSSRLIFLLISVAVAWLLALNSGRELAFNLAYLLTGVLVISYVWARLSTGGIGLRRFTRTQRSQVGQFAEEQFEITNRSSLPKLWLEIDDRSTLPWHAASRVVNSLGRRGVQRWQVKTLCTQRGRFRLGPILLRSGDPLGIFDTKQELARTNFLTVYPLTIDITSFEPSISDLSGGEARHRRTNQMTSNVSTVREYVHGDSLNRIHWPSTARSRRLISKEFELDPTADIWLYVDLFREVEGAMPWTPTPPEPGLFALHSRRRQTSALELPPITTEYAIVVTASLARYFLNRNRAVGMSCRGHTREFLQADRGERQLNKMLESLAVVEAQGSFPFANLIATDGGRLNRNDTIIAISPDPNPDWAIALHQLQRRGVNSVAVVIDGTSFDRPVNYEKLYVELEAAGISTYIVDRTTPIDQSLAHPAHAARSRPPLRL